MAIDVTCPHCQGLLSAPATLAGRTVRCAACNGLVGVPAGPPAAPPAPGPLPAQPAAARRVAPADDRAARPKPSARYKPRNEWDDEDDDDTRRRPPRPAGPPVGVVLGMVAAGVTAVVVFGVVVFVALRAGDAGPPGQAGPPRAAADNPFPPPGGGPVVIGGDQPPGPWPVGVAPASEVGRPPPPDAAGARTTAGLVGRYRDRVALEASSEWQGQWSVASAFDGNDQTSWFNLDDGARGVDPWVKVTFPEDVTVTRVAVRGNREPQWRRGYTILAGKVELLAADGAVLLARELTARNDDFVLTPRPAVRGVRAVKFTSTREESPARNAAVGEVVVE